MSYTPTDIANEALDAIGWPETLGDIEDGTRHAQILLRQYWVCLQKLLRAAHWDCARKTVELNLLADASGNTPNVGTIVPTGWIYEYEYPNDCMKVRFVPWNWANPAAQVPANNIQIPNTPLVTGMGTNPVPMPIVPARFLVATDANYPASNAQQWNEIQGSSPQGRTVILTNVRYAQCVYTCELRYPNMWDPLFRGAMVAFLAAEVALPIWSEKDRKFGMQMREQQAAFAKGAVLQARLTDGNEGFQTSDIPVDWMNIRYNGGGYPAFGGPFSGMGVAGLGGTPFGGGGWFYGGWDTMTVAGATF